ncbi:twin-arginine translocase TatA/TatE family subunit [Falsirhodobacter sp. 20TX0035]|nr:twin-arginine translocase TatA/TatE family subunit [Falsirhodobacter sp. 20TX0035]MDB6454455.1 twin-arginine translocase TatA/TatE family subunit [Falsirhodobacter sp. 20TX0035]
MSGAMSMSHLLVVGVVVLLLFGRGKVASMMGEVGRGMSAFKAGIREGDTDARPALPKDDQSA